MLSWITAGPNGASNCYTWRCRALKWRAAASPSASAMAARVLELLKSVPMSKTELSKNLGQKTVSGQLNEVVRQLVKEQLIEYTLPEKPRSRLQKYRLAEKGRAASANHGKDGAGE